MRHHVSERQPRNLMSTGPASRSQLCLRPFDVGVALRLLLVPEERYEPMSHALVTSTSAVHRAVGRLRQAGICRTGTRTIERAALIEFIACGVPYAYPVTRGGIVTGLPTSTSHDDLSALRHGDGIVVWPSNRHTAQGIAITPLFPGVPQVAMRDPRMHRLLAMVDVIRMRERDARGEPRALLERWVAELGTG